MKVIKTIYKSNGNYGVDPDRLLLIIEKKTINSETGEIIEKINSGIWQNGNHTINDLYIRNKLAFNYNEKSWDILTINEALKVIPRLKLKYLFLKHYLKT